MDLRQLSPDLAVSPQITPEDVPLLAEAGFKVLVTNRPDSEIEPGIDHNAMAAAARAAGMRHYYLPFMPGQITSDLIDGFAEATGGDKPVIAYCRSGHRCTVLWALTQAGKRSEQEILQTATEAGYDLSPVVPLMQSLAQRG